VSVAHTHDRPERPAGKGNVMRKLVAIPLVVVAMAMVAVPAVAAPSIDVEGEWTYVPDFWVVKEVGPNLFIEGTDVGTWTGSLEGTSEEEFVGVFHKDNGNYQGVMEFTGSVLGVYGTMTIKTNGVLQDGSWTGNWVIKHGTGDLAGVHGQGTFWGPPLDLDYEGRVHFKG
jgi:hypothetical protein